MAVSLQIAVTACEAPPDPGASTAGNVERRSSAITHADHWAVLLAHRKSETNSYTPSFLLHSGTNGLPSIQRTGVGAYTVRLPWFTTFGGNVQVNATNEQDSPLTGGDSNRCNVTSWSIDSFGTLAAFIRCFTASGAEADTVFAFNFQRRNQVDIEPFVGAYVWNFRSVGSGSLGGDYHWSSRGGTIHSTHVSPGVYLITLPNLAVPSTPTGSEGSGMVTRYGGSGYCKIGSWFNSGPNRIIQVRCFSVSGNPENALFTLAWGNYTPLGTPSAAYALADQPTNQDFYAPAAPTRRIMFNGTVDAANSDLIEARRGADSSVRRYWITFPNTLNERSRYDSFAVAFGSDNTFCKPVHWPGAHGAGPTLDAAIYTNCYTPTGTRTNSQYVMNYAGQ